MENNPAEENAALQRLAERLIRQQDAGGAKPEAIRAALPAQGRQLVFNGSLQVQSFAGLNILLEVKPESPLHAWTRFGTLAGVFTLLCLLGFLVRKPA